MKIKQITTTVLIVAMLACSDDKQGPVNLITINTETNYPQKELILQEIADVEYITLETTDEFVTKGFVNAIGKNTILVTNSGRDGDIFIFDRKTGKGIRKFNRMGLGSEEYALMTEIVLDDENNEMYINDHIGRKILVYDLQGNYKRDFKHIDESYYSFTYNYDKNHLITFKCYSPGVESEKSAHILISKENGNITHEFQSFFKETETPVYTGMHNQYGQITVTPLFYLTLPSPNGWLLTRTSCDTIYNYSDKNAQPLIARTPSIHSMNSKVFLYPTFITNRYYFMYSQKKELNMNTLKGFPTTDLVYDKLENAVFTYTIYNNDFIDKKSLSFTSRPISKEIAICPSLNAADLVKAYEDGKLNGKLREIAATLNEEDNPVLMLIKYNY